MAKTRSTRKRQSPLASTPTDPHNGFFGFTFGQKEHAIGLLRAALDPALAKRLDWDSLERQPADFVDADLRWRYSDLLFSIRVRETGEEILVYTLVEHQSDPHRLMPLRVLRYLVRIWEEHLKAHKDAAKLPMIVPLVVYSGAKGWAAARSLRDLLDAPAPVIDAAGEHIPHFRFRLIDLRHAGADALLDRLLSKFGEAALWAMATAGDDEAVLAGIARFQDALGELLSKPNGHDALAAFLRYILATHEHIDRSALRATVSEAIGRKAEDDVVTVYEQLVSEGERNALLKQLAVKFGRLSSDVEARVRGASTGELAAWLTNILTVTSLDDVFTAPPRRPRAPAKKPRR